MVKIGEVSTTIAAVKWPEPSEICIDENNYVIRSAMDALRNYKKITHLTVTVLILFAFFSLILDAPRTIATVAVGRHHGIPACKTKQQ
jgi:hypothetical protein